MPGGAGRIACALAASAGLAACGGALGAGGAAAPMAAPQAQETRTMPDPTQAAPARDGNIAIREELDAALAADTPEALRLFIARHETHPLAEIARARLASCHSPGGGTASSGCAPAPNQKQ